MKKKISTSIVPKTKLQNLTIELRQLGKMTDILKLVSLTILFLIIGVPSKAQYTPLYQYKKPNKTLGQVNIPNFNENKNKTFATILQNDSTREAVLDSLLVAVKKIPLDRTDELSSAYEQIEAIKLYNTHSILTDAKPTKWFSVFRIRTIDVDTFNQYLYNQNKVDVFQSAAVQNFTNSNTYVTTELASFLFGPVKLGVGGSFTTKEDTSKDNAIKTSLQKTLMNGGTFNLNFRLPVWFYRNRKDAIHFGVFANVNNGFNPSIDSTGKTDFSKDILYMNQTGADLYFDFGSNDKKARISVDIPLNYVWGSPNAYSQLSQTDFLVAKLQISAVLGDLVNFQLSGPVWSSKSSVRSLPFVLSLQFSPSQVVKAASN